MNFPNLKIVLMCSIFCVSTMNATWGASLMDLGQKLKTSIVQHKVVAGVSAILAGIYTFNKCTDYIFRRKVAHAVEMAKCRVEAGSYDRNTQPDYQLFHGVSMWPNKKDRITITLNPTAKYIAKGEDKPSEAILIKAMISTDTAPDVARIVYQEKC
jgi:hypothetical protein